MAHVLLIEDDAKTREAMTDLLLMGGHKITEAGDGETGLELARSEEPDVILLDFSLPKMHGWAVARQLRADAETQQIPIVAITAHVMVATQDTAIEAGCDAYLTKPIDITTFETWFGEFLASKNLS